MMDYSPKEVIKKNLDNFLSPDVGIGLSPIAEGVAKTPSKAREHTLALRLAERKISQDVINRFDIRIRGDGWTYPTPRGALRFKNADSNTPNKYAWIGEGRDTLLYTDELPQAVQMRGRYVWLTTEFDFFAMQSAGIDNVIAQMQGEGSVPDELPGILQQMGVLVCLIVPHKDDQGATWAQLVANKLTPAGIEVFSRDLPYEQTQKGGKDLGDLWQGYSSPMPFEICLLNLPTVKIKPKTEIKKEISKVFTVPEDRKQAIAARLGISKYNGNGYSKLIPCPFHDDKKPSASLHKEYGLHCFVCGWHRWKDLAAVIGFEWVSVTPAPVYNSTLALGEETIQAMIKVGAGALAYTLEKLYRSGWQVGQTFTMKQINKHVPGWRARKAFAQIEGKGYDLRKQNSRGKRGKRATSPFSPNAQGGTGKGLFCGELTAYFFIPKNQLILNKNPNGRPAKTWKLPNPADIARAFGVTPQHFQPIADKATLPEWAAEIRAQQFDRDPGTYSRAETCKKLGISTTTSQAYDKRAKVAVTPRQERKIIKDATGLPETPDLKGAWLETMDGRKWSATQSGFERAARHAQGGTIYKVKQLVSHYSRGND